MVICSWAFEDDEFTTLTDELTTLTDEYTTLPDDARKTVYATRFCKDGVHARRGQGAYCRPGECSQNMFIDVDEILHVYDVCKCSSWCYNMVIFQSRDIILCVHGNTVYATWFCRHGIHARMGCDCWTWFALTLIHAAQLLKMPFLRSLKSAGRKYLYRCWWQIACLWCF